MTNQRWHTLPDMFFDVAQKRSSRPFLWAKHGRDFVPLGWREAAVAVHRLTGGLAAMGIKQGDRIALISENRPEWVLADLAIMSAGAISVPGYTTNTIEDHRHILENSQACAAIVSTATLARRVIAAAVQVPSVRFVIAIEHFTDAVNGLEVQGWEELLGLEASAPYLAASADDTACIFHTSGTGGRPKGVMLSHRNILANCRGAYQLLHGLGLEAETFLSFLPLSHAYEHSAGLMFPLSIGAEIYFTDAEGLSHDLMTVRPTLMTAVPRLYEVLHQRILHEVQRADAVKRQLFGRALAIGRKRAVGRRLSVIEQLADLGLDKLVRAKLRARFGGRLKAMVSGGAPLNPEIGCFFVALGVPLLQGYGQTEAAPIICCNLPEDIRIDTVGPPFDGVEIRIAEDGEILVSGDNIMQGYWNDPDETERTLINGWLHTGDIGQLDRGGHLRITDRKRDFIKSSGGDMVSPARVEGALNLMPEIAQAMVFGDRRPYLVAVLVPDPEFIAAYSKPRGLSAKLSSMAGDAGLHDALGEVVGQVNRQLAGPERIRRFAIASEPFSVANAQLTPTLKIRRHQIREAYQKALDELYVGRAAAA